MVERPAALGQAHADAKQEVLHETMFCMSFFIAVTVQASVANKSRMEAVRDAFLVLATDIANSDQAVLESALRATADRAAAEVVGKSAEQRFATSQKCAPLLNQGAVEKEIAARTAKQ